MPKRSSGVLKTKKRRKLLFYYPDFTIFVILLFYRIDDCTASAFKTKYGEHFYDYDVKVCAILEIVDECIQSINGNCATDEYFSSDLFIIQQECQQEKSGCSDKQKET